MLSNIDNAAHQGPLSHEQSRRSACDRCRGQKLRCERLSSSSSMEDGCRRCLKAGARCLTTFSHRTSRPRPSTANGSLGLTRPGSMSPPIFDLNHRLTPTSPGSLQPLDAGPQPQQLNLEARSRGSPLLAPNHEPERNHANGPVSALLTEEFLDFTQALADGEVSWPPQEDEGPDRRNIDSTITLNNIAAPPSRGHSPPQEISYRSLNRSRWRRSTNEDIQPLLGASDSWPERLSDLSAVLLEDLNLIESGNVEGMLLSSSTPHQQTTFRNTKAGSQQYGIQQMLKSSEQLILMLRQYKASRLAVPSVDNVPEERDASPSRPTTDWEATATNTTPTPRPQSQCSARGTSEGVDPTVTLLILTCYTTLLRIYKGVFTLIRNSMTQLATPGSTFLPELPNISFDGFDLGRQRSLQIRILLQVSSHLLRQIDEAIQAIRQDAQEGISKGLFDLMLNGSANRPCEGGVLKRGLIQVVRSITQKLNDSTDLVDLLHIPSFC